MLMGLGNCFLEFKLSKLSNMFFLHAFWVTPSASEDFPGGSDSKESACNAGGQGSIPGLGRSPGGGHGNPLQYSCLENPMDRGAWRATVHGVTKSRTRLRLLSTQAPSAGLLRLRFLVSQRRMNSTLEQRERRGSEPQLCSVEKGSLATVTLLLGVVAPRPGLTGPGTTETYMGFLLVQCTTVK